MIQWFLQTLFTGALSVESAKMLSGDVSVATLVPVESLPLLPRWLQEQLKLDTVS